MTDDMHKTFSDDEVVTMYEIRVTSKIARDTGESLMGIEEIGETDIFMKLGMLEYAKDSLLRFLSEDGGEDDDR